MLWKICSCTDASTACRKKDVRYAKWRRRTFRFGFASDPIAETKDDKKASGSDAKIGVIAAGFTYNASKTAALVS